MGVKKTECRLGVRVYTDLVLCIVSVFCKRRAFCSRFRIRIIRIMIPATKIVTPEIAIAKLRNWIRVMTPPHSKYD